MVVVLCLNTAYDICSFSLVGLGTLNECICHARDVFRPAIVAGAFAVVLMHNHPSGRLNPSKADIELTRQINAASELLKIRLLDHVIVGPTQTSRYRYVSLL